jgi:membrane-associated phospholipid phosphatase
VKSGLDMKWEKMSSNNKWVANSGMSAAVLGGLVPLALPLGSYFYGRSNGDKDLQVAGLAMGQAAILGLAISSGIKVFTGRRAPGILDGADTIKSDYSGDFAFGFLRRGAFQGWPSSHTTIAFAMATTLTELYPDNTLLKIGSFAYAAFIGIGVSTNIHWFSDAFAGAFIGYAIGKSVGSEFNQLMSHPGKQQPYRVYATVNSIGIIYNF